MTPTRKGASRLGWVAIGGALIGEWFMTLPHIWWVVFPAGFILVGMLVAFESVLYRWVTAPEREHEDPLT